MRTGNHTIGQMSFVKMLVAITIGGIALAGAAFGAELAHGPQVRPVQAHDYRFDGQISRQVLEDYLSRSISFTELLHDDLSQPRNGRGVDPRGRPALYCKGNPKCTL
jgi:hypothetical protein